MVIGNHFPIKLKGVDNILKEIEKVLKGDYENRVLPFLWQKGEPHEIIADYLERIRAADIREVCLESRPHPDFCGDQWWADLSFIIEKCKELGIKIWLLDDSHFPTGYANGLVKKHPELRKKVLKHRLFDVVGPQTGIGIRLENIFDAMERFYGAVAIQDEEVIDLTKMINNGRLQFSLGKGNWKICVLFISEETAYNEDYINMVDEQSCHLLIEAVYEPHYARFQEEFGETILGFFSDEPGFMNEKGVSSDSLIGKNMPLPWSAEMEQQLKERLGANYMLRLPALFMETTQASDVRYIYMDVATRLYQKCFDEQLGNWCRERGVMHIGHVIEDKDAHARLGVGAGHFFRSMAGQDMAGVDIVINQLVPGMDEGFHTYGRGEWDMEFFTYALAKLGSSLGHIDPLKKGRTVAEVFGAFGWHEGLKLMKWIIDHFVVRGVNYFVPHAFSQADFPDIDCPPHFYARGNNPQFKDFGLLMSYINQMATLFSDGQPHPTAAILYHAEAEWTGAFMPMQKPARELTRHQIDFDFVPVDVFSEKAKYQTRLTEEGLFVNGIHYSCFILPYSQYISSELEEFLQAAATVNFPVYILEKLPEKLYDATREIGDLDFAKVVPLAELVNELHAAGLYEMKLPQPEPWLRYHHYSKEDADYRLFVNEHPQETITTEVAGLTGTAIDLLSGNHYAFDGQLTLEPYESIVIVPEKLVDQPKPFYREAQPLEGTWHVSYSSAKEYPLFGEEKPLPELTDISALYPDQAGVFAYEIDFEVVENLEKAALKLTEAYETVQVFLDGEQKGVKICPPYLIDLGTLSASAHHLRIEVTNTLDKQISDMFSLTETMEPSGLLGSVTLVQKTN